MLIWEHYLFFKTVITKDFPSSANYEITIYHQSNSISRVEKLYFSP